jgi:hypothetical protein
MVLRVTAAEPLEDLLLRVTSNDAVVREVDWSFLRRVTSGAMMVVQPLISASPSPE